MGLRSKTQGPDFFEDFTSQARQLVQAVEFLTHIYAASPEERIALRDQLHEVEHRGDELNHAIVQRINSSFITPFDSEDLQSLASHLDDCRRIHEVGAGWGVHRGPCGWVEGPYRSGGV